MNDKEKREILRLLLQHPNLTNSSASKLKIYLSHCSTKISLKTIETYQSMIENAKNSYDYQTVFDSHDNDGKIIEDIIKHLSRNRDRIKERENYRKNIHNELLKYKHDKNTELSKNKSNISKQNEIKKEIKKELCSTLKDIPQKTLNYLYNDEAKKLDLLPKRSTVDSDFIDKIDTLFKDGTIPKYILDNYAANKSVVQIIQIYIEDNYKIKISRSIIQRYFHKYFEGLMLRIRYENL
jgi:molybdopterin converting factor small subunit